ncbi:uncharacterized protein [Dermacentor albipictus]|uniref:uncharacterized protein isoform X3 n=1 Tax=Dermacentor albipictus TaxID=60249 RepID=UPI0038FC615A
MLHHESLPRPMPLKYAVRFWMSGAISIVFYIANLVGDLRMTCASPGAQRMRQNVYWPILWFLRSVRCSVCGARVVSSQHPAMMVFPQRCRACVPTTKTANVGGSGCRLPGVASSSELSRCTVMSSSATVRGILATMVKKDGCRRASNVCMASGAQKGAPKCFQWATCEGSVHHQERGGCSQMFLSQYFGS